MIFISKKIIKNTINILMLLFMLCGCWSYKELDKIAIVSGIGIDMNDSGEFLMTFQLIKPSQGTSESSTSADEPIWIVETKGLNIFDAIRNASMHSSRKLYLAHNQILVLGQEAAKQNPRGILEFFNRDAEGRVIEKILISDNKASDIIKSNPGLEIIPANNLSSLVDNYKASGKVVSTTLFDFGKALLSDTTSPVAPLAKLDDENVAYLSETAIFKDDTLVGSFNEDETRGYLWITNNISSGIISVSDKESQLDFGMEIVSANTKTKAVVNNDEIVIEIEVNIETVIGNSLKGADTKDIALSRIKELQESMVKSKINAAINKARFYNSDVFGFGEIIRKDNVKQWKKFEKNWDEIFPKIKYVTTVNSKIRNTGLARNKFKEE